MKDVEDVGAVPLVSADRSLPGRMVELLQRDPLNQQLRSDAVQWACDSQHWQMALDLIDAGLQAHPDQFPRTRVLRARKMMRIRARISLPPEDD
jgi:hypothetical protein